jgi:hypothetical protein
VRRVVTISPSPAIEGAAAHGAGAQAPLHVYLDAEPVVVRAVGDRAARGRVVDTLTGLTAAEASAQGGMLDFGVLPRGHYRVESFAAGAGDRPDVDHLAVVP